MANVFTFNMKGFDELVEDFKKIEEETPGAMKETTHKVALKFRRDVKKKTPVRTGTLAKSYKLKGEGLGLDYEETFFADRKKSRAYYFNPLEKGHRVVPRKNALGKRKSTWSGKRYVEGRHMLEDTAEKYVDIYPEEIAKTLEKVLRKHVK